MKVKNAVVLCKKEDGIDKAKLLANGHPIVLLLGYYVYYKW